MFALALAIYLAVGADITLIANTRESTRKRVAGFIGYLLLFLSCQVSSKQLIKDFDLAPNGRNQFLFEILMFVGVYVLIVPLIAAAKFLRERYISQTM